MMFVLIMTFVINNYFDGVCVKKAFVINSYIDDVCINDGLCNKQLLGWCLY